MTTNQSIAGCLAWLANEDRNGLWSEYIEDYSWASEEHGALGLDNLRDLIAEMIEENS